MKILTKYILKEISGPLVFSFFAFLSMFSGFSFISLLRSAERYNLSIWYIVQLLVLRMPEYIIQSAPIAVLLATLLGLGALTSHSETIAMRAGGFNFFKLMMPIMIIGAVVSCGGVLMNEYVVPSALRSYEQMKHGAAQQARDVVINNFGRDFFDSKTGRVKQRLYAARYEAQSETLQQVVIEEFQEMRLSRIVTTEVMHWNGQGWFFENGLIYQLDTDRFYPIKVEQGYVQYDVNLTPKEIETYDQEPENKSISELRQFINKHYPQGSERQRLLVDYHLKFAIPFASMVLALLGAPLALRPQRRSNAAGFGLCIIFILLWYALMGIGSYLARTGAVTPFIGAWLPNILLAGYGVYLSARTKS